MLPQFAIRPSAEAPRDRDALRPRASGRHRRLKSLGPDMRQPAANRQPSSGLSDMSSASIESAARRFDEPMARSLIPTDVHHLPMGVDPAATTGRTARFN